MGRYRDGLHRAFPRQALRFANAVAALVRRLTGVNLSRCPVCRQGQLHVVAAFRPGAGLIPGPDTSRVHFRGPAWQSFLWPAVCGGTAACAPRGSLPSLRRVGSSAHPLYPPPLS